MRQHTRSLVVVSGLVRHPSLDRPAGHADPPLPPGSSSAPPTGDIPPGRRVHIAGNRRRCTPSAVPAPVSRREEGGGEVGVPSTVWCHCCRPHQRHRRRPLPEHPAGAPGPAPQEASAPHQPMSAAPRSSAAGGQRTPPSGRPPMGRRPGQPM